MAVKDITVCVQYITLSCHFQNLNTLGKLWGAVLTCNVGKQNTADIIYSLMSRLNCKTSLLESRSS